MTELPIDENTPRILIVEDEPKLGQLLMERTIETALECKAAKITLEVKESNTPAIKLYMKNGFIPVGVKPNYYHDGSDAIYMQRHM